MMIANEGGYRYHSENILKIKVSHNYVDFIILNIKLQLDLPDSN